MAIPYTGRYEVFLEADGDGLRGIATPRAEHRMAWGKHPVVAITRDGLDLATDAAEHLAVDLLPLLSGGDTLSLHQEEMGGWSIAARRGEQWLWGAGSTHSMPDTMLGFADARRVEALSPGEPAWIGDFVAVGLGRVDLGMGCERYAMAMARHDAAVDLAPLVPIAAQLQGLGVNLRFWSVPRRYAHAAG